MCVCMTNALPNINTRRFWGVKATVYILLVMQLIHSNLLGTKIQAIKFLQIKWLSKYTLHHPFLWPLRHSHNKLLLWLLPLSLCTCTRGYSGVCMCTCMCAHACMCACVCVCVMCMRCVYVCVYCIFSTGTLEPLPWKNPTPPPPTPLQLYVIWAWQNCIKYNIFIQKS